MRYDSGESAAEVEEGYDIKLGHVDDALQRIGIGGVDTFAFDATSDNPAELTNFVLQKIESVRKVQAEAARATIVAIDQMIANREEAQAIAALEKVGATLERFAARHAALRAPRRPFARELAQFDYRVNADIPVIKTVFVLTFSDGTNSAQLYNSMAISLGNFVESAVLTQDIEIET